MQRQVVLLVGFVVGMFGFGFALVPLYDVFCEITGLNGKTSNTAAERSALTQVDTTRWVNVEFIGHPNPAIPWEFKPVTRRLKVRPGEEQVVYYRATNLAGFDTVGQAVPSVSPGLAAKHLNKIECFCFNNQPLAAGESVDMAVRFFVDAELPKSISTLTLSYTLYNVEQPKAVAGKTADTAEKTEIKTPREPEDGNRKT